MTAHFGSFKIVPKGDERPSGRLEFTFSGTVLLSDLAPGSYLKTTGNVRTEYDSKEHGKRVLFGKGKVLLIGRFKNCQWFGRDLDFTFKGSGLVRVISEFDKNLDTGLFWFDAIEKNPLQTNLIELPVPNQRAGALKAITREEFEKRKKAGKGG